MCGIFGVGINDRSNFSAKILASTIKNLFELSESRGKEASGLAVLLQDSIEVLKSPFPASQMISTPTYHDLLRRSIASRFSKSGDRTSIKQSIVLIGHARLVTTGSHELLSNNQPVIAGNAVGIHNGIIAATTENSNLGEDGVH